MKEHSKSPSFSLMLEPYCEYCGEFSADVSTIEISHYGDLLNGRRRFITNIRCEHADRCNRICENARMKECNQ